MASALNPRPTLEVNELLTVTDMCVADIPNADHMVNVAYSSWLRDIPASQYGDIGRQIKAYWQKQGYDIQTSGGFSTGKRTALIRSRCGRSFSQVRTSGVMTRA